MSRIRAWFLRYKGHLAAVHSLRRRWLPPVFWLIPELLSCYDSTLDLFLAYTVPVLFLGQFFPWYTSIAITMVFHLLLLVWAWYRVSRILPTLDYIEPYLIPYLEQRCQGNWNYVPAREHAYVFFMAELSENTQVLTPGLYRFLCNTYPDAMAHIPISMHERCVLGY